MKILGIETSCDETAAAVIKGGTKILSNVVATSADMHAETGGIIPEEAAREQAISIIPVINKALENADSKKEDVDKIAVTSGPGLIGSLLVGVETAKTLSFVWGKPLIPVNHLAAHIYANWLEQKPPELPALCLVVSGGHTDIVLMKKHGHLKWLGGTRDDAAGEAFDKTARLLGLPYPGGPAISKKAEEYLDNKNSKLNLFPRPMIDEENYHWSFSGLKTAVIREVKKDKEDVPRLAAEIQEAIVDVLVLKTLKAIKKIKPKSFLLAGGVAANKRLTEKFKNKLKNIDIDFRVPPPKLCTDNATYVSTFAYFNQNETSWEKVTANPNLEITREA